MGATRRLLDRICAIFHRVPVFPTNALCSLPTSRCPSGADTNIPYAAIFSVLESILAFASA